MLQGITGNIMPILETPENSGLRRHVAEDLDSGTRKKAVNPLREDERWLAALRIASSGVFSKSTRLSAFLRYVCEKALTDCTDEISEQQIGVNVFGKPTDYNPGDDNIVRGSARQLRQKLALYYQEEGAQESIRITIPRGGYVPQFEMFGKNPEPEVLSARASSTEHTSPDMAAPTRQRSQTTRIVIPGLMFLLGAMVMGTGTYLLRHPVEKRSKSSQLWRALFSPDKRTLMVAGDAGLNMFSNLAKRQVAADEYSSGSYLASPFAQTPPGYTWTPFPDRQYTSFPDLLLISKLSRLPEVDPKRLDVRFARDIKLDDLKKSNAILIGSENYDPWVQLFHKGSDFELTWDGTANTFTVTNKAPLPGESRTYQRPPESQPGHDHGFTLITYINHTDGDNKVLMIEGTTLVGISAAVDFLTDEDQLSPIVQRSSKLDGSLKSFEVLLATDFVDGNSQNTRVIATHIHN